MLIPSSKKAANNENHGTIVHSPGGLLYYGLVIVKDDNFCVMIDRDNKLIDIAAAHNTRVCRHKYNSFLLISKASLSFLLIVQLAGLVLLQIRFVHRSRVYSNKRPLQPLLKHFAAFPSDLNSLVGLEQQCTTERLRDLYAVSKHGTRLSVAGR